MSRKNKQYNNHQIMGGSLTFFEYLDGLKSQKIINTIIPQGHRDKSPGVNSLEIHLKGYDYGHKELIGELLIPNEGTQYFRIGLEASKYIDLLPMLEKKYKVVDKSK